MDKPSTFNCLSDAVQVAGYIETLRNAEYQWIQSRLSWLFISQSFCISTYAVLANAITEHSPESRSILTLKIGLPVFGIISCVLVGLAVLAAARVARRLTAERKNAVRYVNEHSPLNIPEAGRESDPTLRAGTYWAGELPHRVLPWTLGILWLLLLIG